MKARLTALLYILISTTFALGQPSSNSAISAIGKVVIQKDKITLFRSLEGDTIPSELKDPKLEKIILNLNQGDEAIVKGYISYAPTTVEDQTNLRPVFIIESIQPISLKMLGMTDLKDDYGARFPIISSKNVYSPMAIPVTTEVASALTLTTSILLMQSLTASSSQPQVTQQLNSGLILFAGMLATGIFIYEQVTETQKEKSND